MSNNNRKAIAIDGNSLLYRCFYATFKQLPYYAQHNIQPTNASFCVFYFKVTNKQ